MSFSDFDSAYDGLHVVYPTDPVVVSSSKILLDLYWDKYSTLVIQNAKGKIFGLGYHSDDVMTAIFCKYKDQEKMIEGTYSYIYTADGLIFDKLFKKTRSNMIVLDNTNGQDTINVMLKLSSKHVYDSSGSWKRIHLFLVSL